MPQKTLGIMHSGHQGKQQASIKYFKDELDRWVKGTAITIVWDSAGVLWSDDDPNLLAQNADTLARNANLDMIIAAGGSASVYAVQAAQTAAGTNTNVVFTTFSQMNSPCSKHVWRLRAYI
jgi:ABC-type sugar transport system substrate-binding protein